MSRLKLFVLCSAYRKRSINLGLYAFKRACCTWSESQRHEESTPNSGLGCFAFGSRRSRSIRLRLSNQRCPQSCSTTGPQMSAWTPYHSLDRPELCLYPILFGFNIHNDLDKYQTIKACTASEGSTKGTVSSICSSMSSVPESLELAWDSTSSDSASSTVISQVSLALQSQVENDATCGNGSTILFAHYQDLVAGLYVGAAFVSVTTARNLVSQISKNQESIAGCSASAQLCGSDRDASRTLGLMLSTSSDYRIVQSAVRSWANATCVQEFTNTNVVSNTKFSQLPKQNATGSIGTIVQKRADTCSYITVDSGNGCDTLATRCGRS